MSESKELQYVPRQGSALALMSPADIRATAESIARSRLFKGFESPDAAFALMMLCQAEGLHPIQAVRRYDVIDGRPAMKSDAMLAEFQKRGGEVEWLVLSSEKVAATFAGPGCKKPVEISWTIEDAKRAGLTGKQNWAKYPRAMLRARVVSEGIRTTMPEVVVGIYTPEEVADFEPAYIPPAPTPPRSPETEAKLAAEAEKARAASAAFANGTARDHREAPGHGPKAPPAPSAGSSSSAPSAASSSAPSASTTASTATPAAGPSAPATPGATSTALSVAPSPASSTESPATPSPGATSSDPKGEAASSAESTSSTPPGAQDASCPSDAGDLVKCEAFGRDGRVLRATMEPRRSEAQMSKLFSVFRSRGIEEHDGVDEKGVPVKGWRSRIKTKWGKDSTKDLSVRECSFMIDQLERFNERFGDKAAKEQKHRENGFEKRQDGSWGGA